MSAIERCRTAALGGHVMRCENDACGYTNGGAAGLPPVPHGPGEAVIQMRVGASRR